MSNKCCKICRSKLYNILNLNKQPPANSIFKRKKPKSFPLILSICKNCKLLQLSEFPSKKYLFNKYFWVTGTSTGAKKFAKIFYKKLSKSLKPNSNVFEIASNDGTFLKEFKKNKHYILGIDPAKNISKIANSKGIRTIPDFFNYSKSIKIKKYFKPDLIFARNAIPHVSNLSSVVRGISNLCNDKTKVAIEFHYAENIYNELQYHSIYHEHIFYFTIKSLSKIFDNYNLYPEDLFVSPISGGAIVLIFSRNKNKKSNLLKKYILNETKKKINELNTWKKFSKKAKIHAQNFKKLIIRVFKTEGKIFAYGASARSSTLLNYSGVDNKYLDFIIDQNPLKEGYFTPGSNIKIITFKNVANLIKNYKTMILLAWNFKEEITKFMIDKKYKGRFIIPFKKR